MGDAGQVFIMSGSNPRDGISRDCAQHKPHMTASVDPVLHPLNQGTSVARGKQTRKDEWSPHPLDVTVVQKGRK